jgi:hypothetical protein
MKIFILITMIVCFLFIKSIIIFIQYYPEKEEHLSEQGVFYFINDSEENIKLVLFSSIRGEARYVLLPNNLNKHSNILTIGIGDTVKTILPMSKRDTVFFYNSNHKDIFLFTKGLKKYQNISKLQKMEAFKPNVEYHIELISYFYYLLSIALLLMFYYVSKKYELSFILKYVILMFILFDIFRLIINIIYTYNHWYLI